MTNLNINQIANLANALDSLSGYVIGLTNGKPVTVPYKFTGKTRWNIAKNVGVLKKILETFDEARKALVAQVTNGKGFASDSPDQEGYAEFQALIKPLTTEDHEVEGLLNICADDILKDENPVPSGIIEILMPLLTAPTE